MNVDISQGSSGPSPSRIAILVVEDETLIRLLAADSLQDAGFEVIAAVNAAEAIAILESDARIDFVFTDIMMPGSMNGIGLGAWIRARRPELPIAFTSGVARAIMLTLGLRDGDAFFAKPVTFDGLVRHIHATVAMPQAAAAT